MSSLVKRAASKRFLKEATGLRVGDEVSARFVELVQAVASSMVAQAQKHAEADDRNTLMERDLEASFENFLQEGAAGLSSPQTLHQAISDLSTEDFVQLTQLLRQDLEEEP